MIEDKLTHAQRVRLESVAQANALISARPFGMTVDKDDAAVLLETADRIAGYIRTDDAPDLDAVARDVRRYGLTAHQWCDVMSPGGPESLSDMDWTGVEGAYSEYRMNYPEFMARAIGCTWRTADYRTAP